MCFSKGRINNKEKQAVAGNWGHPGKFTKQHTKISDPLIPEKDMSGRAIKKKKKQRRVYKSPYEHCPFCETELPIDEKKLEEDRIKFGKMYYRMYIPSFGYRAKECPNCKAKEVIECPACKRHTWMNLEGTYKHMGLGCGFNGKRKYN
jgi:hypothetical protein